MRRLYLSGPISLGGELDDGGVAANVAVFHDAAATLRHAGYTVVNPVEITEHLDVDSAWEEFMRVDLQAMLECDGVALLPLWQRSRGARLECFLALEVGLEVKSRDHWLMLAAVAPAVVAA